MQHIILIIIMINKIKEEAEDQLLGDINFLKKIDYNLLLSQGLLKVNCW